MMPKRRNETTMSLGQRSPADAIDVPDPVFIPEPSKPAGGPSITLVIMNSGRRIKLDIGEDLLIGRKDNARGIFPDVDLGLDGGYDAGVSRRHAILSHQDGTYRIEDLNSANGTFVNDQRVAPSSITTLSSGDEVKCGTLLMRVEFS